MPAGRPTKYTPELVEKAWNYLNGEWKEVHEHAFPSILGLCRVLNITRSTAYDWADQEEKEFSDILALMGDASEFNLVQGGLNNELNSNITKLVLGKFGYKERSETDVNLNTAEEWLERMADEDE